MLQLKKFPDKPDSTREEARESRLHPEEHRFRLLAREVGSFPCLVGKDFLAFPSHLKRRRSPQERREELQGRATIPRVPQMSQSILGNIFSLLGSTFKPRIDSHHGGTWDSPVGKPRGKASWESLMGKPRAKATDPLIRSTGSVTLLLQLGRVSTCMPPLETRTDSPGETPEVPQDPCQHCRGILRFRHRLHTRS